MNTNDLNVELAERVILETLIHPEQHNQHGWYYESQTCGTTACLAGWTVLLGASPDQAITCIEGDYDWPMAANRLLFSNQTAHQETCERLTDAFYTYDNELAIARFCTIFGLDLEALTEKAKASRGEIGYGC